MLRTRHLLVGLVAAGAVVAAGCSSAPSGSPPFSSLPPAGVVQTATASADRAGSMHFLDVTTSGKNQSTLVGKISASAAEEAVQGSEPFQIILHDATIYVRGGTGILTSALSLTSAQATAYAGKWIAVSSTDAPFETISGTLTLQAELNSYLPANPLSFGKKTTLHGHRVVTVLGAAPASATGGGSGSNALFVATTGAHYPVGGSIAVTSKSGSYHEYAVFDDWGKPVTTSAPDGAIPLSSITGSA